MTAPIMDAACAVRTRLGEVFLLFRYLRGGPLECNTEEMRRGGQLTFQKPVSLPFGTPKIET